MPTTMRFSARGHAVLADRFRNGRPATTSRRARPAPAPPGGIGSKQAEGHHVSRAPADNAASASKRLCSGGERGLDRGGRDVDLLGQGHDELAVPFQQG